MPPNQAHFGSAPGAGNDPRLVRPLTQIRLNERRLTQMEIIVVSTGEPVAARYLAFQAI